MKEPEVINRSADSMAEAKDLAAGYTWYTNTLYQDLGLKGVSVIDPKKVLIIRYKAEYLVYYKK